MEVQQLCQAFLTHYYQQFHNNRASLNTLYRPESTLTMTGEKCQGPEAIVAKLQTLPPCQAQALTFDCQPSPTNGALILINGNLMIAPGQSPKYCETFNIQPIPGAAGQYFIQNHVFRVQQ